MTQAEALNLRPREARVIERAIWARTVTPNGHYLCSPGEVKAARRMIQRGFLSKARRTGDVTFGGSDDWLVIVLTKKNVAAINANLQKAARANGEAPNLDSEAKQ